MTQVAVIGAGPYGLSIAAHLTEHGVENRVFGTPLDTWRRHMPAGMMLKSDGFASNLSDLKGVGTLRAYCAERGIEYHDTDIPVPLELFNEYALNFQQRFVPHLEDNQVIAVDRKGDGFKLELDSGEVLEADYVIAAVGIKHFCVLPDELAQLPASLVTHSSAHGGDLSVLAGRDITVIGGGASAVDYATLLSEAGAHTSLIARGSSLRFFSEPHAGPRSRWEQLRHPSSGLGPGLRSWVCETAPNLFRFLPGKYRLEIIKRHLGPKAGYQMKARLHAGVKVSVNEHVERAAEDNGRARLWVRNADGGLREVVTDHVIAATGYSPDVSKLEFLSENLRASIETHHNMPVVSGDLQSSVSGLYFVGPPAVNSFGPLMRFMVGAEYVAPLVGRRVARRAKKARSAHAQKIA